MISDLQRICAEMDPPIELLPTHVRKRGQAQIHASGPCRTFKRPLERRICVSCWPGIVESPNNRSALYGPLIWAVSDRVDGRTQARSRRSSVTVASLLRLAFRPR